MVLLTNCLGAAHFSINQQKRLGHHLPPIPHLGCAVAGRLGRGRSGGLFGAWPAVQPRGVVRGLRWEPQTVLPAGRQWGRVVG